MSNISPMAFIHPEAVIGENCEIGPFCFIDKNVVIGDNNTLMNSVTLLSGTRMGSGNTVFPGAVIGAIPQDLKFDGEVTYVEIGDNVTIRECVTINRGTKASGKGITKVGSNTLIMSYVHIAHDCTVGNHCILVSYVGIAGETEVADWAIIGGGAKAHQFTKIGCHAMVGGMSKINKDIPPYALCGRDPICYAGVNIVGLRRRGFSADVVRNIKDIYDTIYYQGYNITDGCAKVEAGFPDSEEKATILNFIRSSKRGIIKANNPGEKGDID